MRVSSVTKSTRHSRARDWLGGSHDPGIRSPDGRYANSPAKAAGHFEPLTALRGARLVRNSSQLLTCGEAPLGAGCGVESSAPHHRCRPRSSSEGGRGGGPHLRDAQSSEGRRAALPIEEACHAFGCHRTGLMLVSSIEGKGGGRGRRASAGVDASGKFACVWSVSRRSSIRWPMSSTALQQRQCLLASVCKKTCRLWQAAQHETGLRGSACARRVRECGVGVAARGVT